MQMMAYNTGILGGMAKGEMAYNAVMEAAATKPSPGEAGTCDALDRGYRAGCG